MTISFIIPFYGPVSLLKRCLDSLATQTDSDFEAVVVDDCSPECARDLVSQYDTRFRYVRQSENRGPYQGRVRGIEEARGEYVVDVDCDDYVKPELVAELRKAIERNQADIVVYNVEQDAAGVITPHWCHYEPGVYSSDDVMARLVAKKLQWNFWAKAIRRDIIFRTWEIVPDLRTTRVLAPDDFCAIVPMILASERIEVIGYVGHRYWQGSQSICRGISFTKVWNALRDTHEARRLVLDFSKRTRQSAVICMQIKAVARTIFLWWLSEFLHAAKKGLFSCGVVIGLVSCTAQAAQITEVTLPSKLLQRHTPVTIVLPNGYASNSNCYPVVYLLHGYGGSNKTFVMGDYRYIISQAADDYRFILVMPDGDKDRCWIDAPVLNRSWYESFVQAELVQFVDRNYRTRADRSGRAIVGVSMGGFGAWWIGIRHPEIFGSAGSILGCVELLDSPDLLSVRRLLGDAGENADRWRDHSILRAAETLENGRLDLISINATEDLFIAGNRRLHLMLSNRRIRHAYIEICGEDFEHSSHTGTFATMAMRMMLYSTSRFFIQGNGVY